MNKDYYVYLHKDIEGVVFYVGKGRARRAWEKSSRSKGWEEISSKGYSIEMYAENLSEKDALAVESKLILSIEGLTNTRIFTPVRFDDYAEYFEYSPDSPSGLTRIKSVSGSNGSKLGKLGSCGHKRTRSCGAQSWMIKFKNRNAQVHRVIWQLINGEIPAGFVVDHIDGNSLNNKISNLRVVSQAENSRNTRKDKDNTSGITGVYFYTDSRSNRSYWCANSHNLKGERISRYFSVEKVGFDEAYQSACEHRQQMIAELNAQGAGYTERHGT